MSGFKAVVLWVPEPRRALANGAIMAFGALGVLVATVPTELAVQAVGWRAVFVALSAITFAVAALIFLAVPERGASATGEDLARQIAALLRILSDGAFWRLAPLLATTAGSHIAIQTLWAGPWFRDVAGLDRIGVANYLMVVAIAFFVGILLTSAVADWFVRRGVDLLTVMLGFIAVFLLSELAIVLQWTSLNLLMWVVFGMTGQVAVLAYPWLASYFGAALSGRATDRHEPRAVPRRVRRAVRDRGDHRSVSDHPGRRLRPERLPGRLRRLSRGAAPGAGLVSARPALADGRGATVDRDAALDIRRDQDAARARGALSASSASAPGATAGSAMVKVAPAPGVLRRP